MQCHRYRNIQTNNNVGDDAKNRANSQSVVTILEWIIIGCSLEIICYLFAIVKIYDDVHNIKCWCVMFHFQREAINRTRALLEKRRAERMDAELKRIEAERSMQ